VPVLEYWQLKTLGLHFTNSSEFVSFRKVLSQDVTSSLRERRTCLLGCSHLKALQIFFSMALPFPKKTLSASARNPQIPQKKTPLG